tara:strand:- start:734 stop:1864 length:1131 start_codon:yes stop_codon:yes gene_type:complete
MSTLKVDTITNLSGSRDTALDVSVPLKLTEGAAPSSTASGYGYLYTKTDGKLYFDSDNLDNEVDLTSGGVGTGAANIFTRGQVIDGGQNEVQLQIQSNGAPQAANLFEITTSTSVNKYLTVTGGGNLKLNQDSSIFSLGVHDDFTITHDGGAGATISGSPVNISSTNSATTFSSVNSTLTLNGGTGVYLQESNSTVISIDNNRNVVIGDATSGETIRIGHSTSETTIGDNLTVSGNLEVNGILDNTTLQSYKETICTSGAGVSSATTSATNDTIVMDMNEGNVFYFQLPANNCTIVQFDNMVAGQSATLILKQNGSSAVTFPHDIVKIGSGGSNIRKFPSGEAPQYSTGTNDIDVFTYFCLDTSNILVMVGGLDFS